MDITKMSVVELKALLFDMGQENTRLQQNVQLVLAELKKKVEAENKPEKKPKA